MEETFTSLSLDAAKIQDLADRSQPMTDSRDSDLANNPSNTGQHNDIDRMDGHMGDSAARPITPESKVFSTYELIDQILSNLSLRDLTRVQRVSRTWHDITLRSPTLRSELRAFLPGGIFGLEADPKRCEVHPLIADLNDNTRFDTPYPRYRLEKLLELRAGTWEDMFICLPTLTILKINGVKGRKTDSVVIYDITGVRLGKLMGGLREWMATDLGRDDARRNWDNRMSNCHFKGGIFNVIVNSVSTWCRVEACSKNFRCRGLCEGGYDSAVARAAALDAAESEE